MNPFCSAAPLAAPAGMRFGGVIDVGTEVRRGGEVGTAAGVLGVHGGVVEGVVDVVV